MHAQSEPKRLVESVYWYVGSIKFRRLGLKLDLLSGFKKTCVKGLAVCKGMCAMFLCQFKRPLILFFYYKTKQDGK